MNPNHSVILLSWGLSGVNERNLASGAVSSQDSVFLPKPQGHEHLTRISCLTRILLKSLLILKISTLILHFFLAMCLQRKKNPSQGPTNRPHEWEHWQRKIYICCRWLVQTYERSGTIAQGYTLFTFVFFPGWESTNCCLPTLMENLRANESWDGPGVVAMSWAVLWPCGEGKYVPQQGR